MQEKTETIVKSSDPIRLSPRATRINLAIPQFYYFLTTRLEACYNRLLEMKKIPPISYMEFYTTTCKRVTGEAVEPSQIVIQALECGNGIEEEKRAINSPLGPIAVGLIYALRGKILSEQAGRKDIAWSYITDSAYWTSAAVGGMKFQDIQGMQQSERGNKGGTHRSDKYKKLKNDVLELIKNHPNKPRSGWRSVNSACEFIWPDVKDLASSYGVNLPVTERTVKTWISESAGYGKYFHVDSLMAKKDKQRARENPAG